LNNAFTLEVEVSDGKTKTTATQTVSIG